MQAETRFRAINRWPELLAVVVVAAMLLWAGPAVGQSAAVSGEATATGQLSYTDLEGHWSQAAVIRASAKGIAYGDGEGQFHADAAASREDTAIMGIRVLGLGATAESRAESESEVSVGFSDLVGVSAYNRAHISVAKDAGFMVGDGGDTTFRPADGLRRAETATILVRALGLEGEAEARMEGDAEAETQASLAARFTDGDEIPAWAAGHVDVAVEAGLFEGYPEAEGAFSFRWERSTTRAELVVLMDRLDAQIESQLDEREVRGALVMRTEVDGTTELTVETPAGVQVKVELAQDAVVFVDGEAAAAADLSQDARVRVVLNDEGKAVSVSAEVEVEGTARVAAETFSYGGHVAAVSESEGTVTVTVTKPDGSQGDVTVMVTSATTIIIDGEEGALADIEQDSEVHVFGDLGAAKTATSINVLSQASAGS